MTLYELQNKSFKVKKLNVYITYTFKETKSVRVDYYNLININQEWVNKINEDKFEDFYMYKIGTEANVIFFECTKRNEITVWCDVEN